MDIAGGAKEGANKGGNLGKWFGLAAGLVCGALAVTVFLASAGIAVPGIAVTSAMGHATLNLAQLIFPSVVGIAICAWAGMALGDIFGGLFGGLFGGIDGISKDPEPPGGRTRNPPSHGPGLNNQRSAQRMAPAPTSPTPIHTPGNNSPEEYSRGT